MPGSDDDALSGQHDDLSDRAIIRHGRVRLDNPIEPKRLQWWTDVLLGSDRSRAEN